MGDFFCPMVKYICRLARMKSLVLLNNTQVSLTLDRLAYQVFERHGDLKDTVLIALQPRGVHLGRRILEKVKAFSNKSEVPYGELDITFYRDDFRRRDGVLIPSSTNINFSIENKKVVLIDDVLFTGRTVRSGLDALLDFGRPETVELLVLIDRRFSRELPVQPDYTGRTVDVISEEKVRVDWSENNDKNEVILFSDIQNDEG